MSRIDIMVDLETLGTDADATLIQIAAAKFDIYTGKILEVFDMYPNIRAMPKLNASGSTLMWWMIENADTFKDVLSRENCYSESECLSHFSRFVTENENISKDAEVYLWGNGILFDNKIIQHKMENYGIKYPIHYRNDRDMRTIVDIAATRMKMSNIEFIQYVNSHSEKEYIKHDACQDVESQIEVVTCAWNILIYDTM